MCHDSPPGTGTPEVKGSQNTELRVLVSGPQRPLHPLLRDEVYRVGREVLTNAVRHARVRKIEVELQYSSKQLRLLVRDDGCGIDPSLAQARHEQHRDLSSMRERADRIGGRLQILSSALGGTEVELSVPGHIAFQDHGLPVLIGFGKRWGRRTRRQKSKKDAPSAIFHADLNKQTSSEV